MTDRRAVTAGLARSALLATGARAAATLGEIDTLRRRFAEVLFTRDHAALPGLLTADTLILPAGKPMVRGREAAVAFWTAATADPDRRFRSEFAAVDMIAQRELVIETGRATVFIVERGTERLADRGKYILVWQREDGRWKRHRDIFNSDGPVG